MPLRDGKKTSSSCWTNRSRLELILMGVIFIAILIAVILLIFIILKPSQAKPVELPSDVCHTSICIQEAAQILQRIDPNINPCEDFYHFACGNFLKSSHGDEHLNSFYQMHAQLKRELLEMYAEDNQDSDHKMVKSVKNLFKECMNETAIENDNLNSIKMVLQEIGGWPALLKSTKWNESNFDWLSATYKLRELGYPFTIFLNFDIKTDNENNGKYIFKVELPDIYNGMLSRYSKEQAVEIMAEIATLFGAEDRQFAFKQMDGTYRFWKYLNTYGVYSDKILTTINNFEEKYGKTFNWFEFINNITGPTVQISKEDYVLFQNEEGLHRWLELITTTPKRTLANYMVWKVIENQLPYLPKNIRNLDAKRDNRDYLETIMFESIDETRAEFCLKEIQKRFIYGPIEIMHNRKYLPLEKRKRIEEIQFNIQSEFVNLLNNTDLIEKEDKQITVAKAKAITVVVGKPGNYFDDKCLDDLDVDMVDDKTNTFLNLLAQVNRNYQTILYNLTTMTPFENFMNIPYNKYPPHMSTYDEEANVLVVPQRFGFQENRPNYLNYARIWSGSYGLSSLLGFWFYLDIGRNTVEWSNATKLAFENLKPCLRESTKECQVDDYTEMESTLVGLNLGEKISYAAYEKWVKLNGEEKKLIGVNYTPRQLFWISTTICQPTNIYSKMYTEEYPLLPQQAICASKSNNFEFAKDFNCPPGSKMNRATKCRSL